MKNKSNAGKNIGLAFFLNLFFAIVEIVGGLLTNSVAILSDALHDLVDSFSLGLAWYLQRISGRGEDKAYLYGYGRFPLLGSIINAFFLLLGAIFILQEAIPRIIEPQAPNAEGMFFLALVGIVVNGFAVHRLRSGGSLAEEMVSLHLLEDVLGWVAVLIGSVVMIFWDLPILDPILSIGIVIWVLWNVFKNLRKCFTVLLQAAPQGVDMQQMEDRIQDLRGVKRIASRHAWSLDGQSHVLTLKIEVNRAADRVQDQAALKREILEITTTYGFEHNTIELLEEGSSATH